MSETTFGCGEFLPGRGPFNFPDFIEGGTINNPGPDPGQDPTDPNTTTPPDIVECECRPKELGTVAIFPLFETPSWSYYVAEIEKECTEIVNGLPADNSVELIQQLQAQLLAQGGINRELTGTELGSEDCIDPEPDPNSPPLEELECSDKNCDPIRVFYRDKKAINIAGPSTPGPTTPGPGNIGPVSQKCQCTIVDKEPLVLGVPENGGYSFSAIWDRECVDRSSLSDPANASSLESENIVRKYATGLLQNSSSDRYIRIGTGVRTIDPRCPEKLPENECDKDFDCGQVLLTWFVQELVNVGQDLAIPGGTEQRTTGGSTIGEGGSVTLGQQSQTTPSVTPIYQPTPGATTQALGSWEGFGNLSKNKPVDINSGNKKPTAPVETTGATITDSNNLGEVPKSTRELSVLARRLQKDKEYKEKKENYLPKVLSQNSIDLSDPALVRRILNQRPNGVEDEEVYFDLNPKQRKRVKNTSKKTNIFKDQIDESLLILLEANLDLGTWDSTRAGDITPALIYENLNDEARSILSRVVNYDRTPLNIVEIYSIIGTRVLDGTISDINLAYLKRLEEGSRDESPFSLTRSNSRVVNETIALALIESNYASLDNESFLGRGREALKNKKVLSSDVDKYLPITIDGQVRRYYIADDDTFIDRSTLSLKDGDYFDIFIGGENERLFAESERNHAFFVPEKTRQIAVKLLGGDPSRVLSVSADPLGLELDYSLSAPRQNIYFLSGLLDTIQTSPEPANPKFLKKSRVKYVNVPLENIDQINEYIKHKDNHQTFILDDDDILIDYIEEFGEIFMEQTDILLDSPKENQDIPLLTRQIPWYILVYPTNRTIYNPFNTKSQITNYAPSADGVPASMTRALRTATTIIPDLRNSYNQFISVRLAGRDGVDVFGNPDTQARINVLDLSNTLINAGYEDENNIIMAASEFERNRQRSGYRLLSEIITELDTNYHLGLNGIGKSLTEFDVLSRFTLRQFNKLAKMENFAEMKRTVFNGAINGVKVVPATKDSDSKIALRKTQLVFRKSAAPATDTFRQIKPTNFGRTIVPPTVQDPPTFGDYEPIPAPDPSEPPSPA